MMKVFFFLSGRVLLMNIIIYILRKKVTYYKMRSKVDPFYKRMVDEDFWGVTVRKNKKTKNKKLRPVEKKARLLCKRLKFKIWKRNFHLTHESRSD